MPEGLALSLPPELLARVKDRASTDGLGFSEAIRQLLEAGLAAPAASRRRKRGRPIERGDGAQMILHATVRAEAQRFQKEHGKRLRKANVRKAIENYAIEGVAIRAKRLKRFRRFGETTTRTQ
jgi:hypothetical protein